MCFFKKKKKVVITNNKYQVGQFVSFRYKGEVCPGVIYDIKLDKDDNVIYDVQVGGECPFIVNNVEEKIIFIKNKGQ